MEAKPDKFQLDPEVLIVRDIDVEDRLLIYTLLRIFHVFMEMVSKTNNDNIGVVTTILQDFRKDFDGLYNRLFDFFSIFCEQLQELDNMKLTTEHLELENRFVVKFELNYAVIGEYTRRSEPSEDNVQHFGTHDIPQSVEEDEQEESEPDFDLKIADLELPPVETELTSTYLNDMLNDLSLLPTAEDTVSDEDDSLVEEMKNENQKIDDNVPVVDIPVETFGVGASTPATEQFIPEEDSPEEQELNVFQAKLEQQRQEFRIRMEALKEERKKKRMAHDAEMKDLRRQQKQRFATIMQCIFLKQRFEEKESDWSSWINNSLRQLIVKVVGKFGDFQDFSKNFSNFKKLYKEDPEDVISEIGDLNRAILTLLYDLEAVFNKLAKVDQDFESVMFVQVIQKRISNVATNLTELLFLLEEIEYTNDWYQNLERKMTEIQPSQIPKTKELRNICKNLNKEEYKNLEFPKWESKSQVIIEKVYEEDEKFVDINIDKESSLRNLDREQKQSFATQQPQELEQQMKLREDELRMREDKLDKKMDEIKSMEVHLDKKVDEIRLTEENLGRKMEETMAMMKLVIGSTATAGYETPATRITGQVQGNTTDTGIIEPSVTQSDSNGDVLQAQIQTTSVDELTEDEELRQMEEQFQRAKAEQDRKNELELRNAQERRREINERAAEERRRISENLARAASFQNSLHS